MLYYNCWFPKVHCLVCIERTPLIPLLFNSPPPLTLAGTSIMTVDIQIPHSKQARIENDLFCSVCALLYNIVSFFLFSFSSIISNYYYLYFSFCLSILIHLYLPLHLLLFFYLTLVKLVGLFFFLFAPNFKIFYLVLSLLSPISLSSFPL
jgi:hypothetical protein